MGDSKNYGPSSGRLKENVVTLSARCLMRVRCRFVRIQYPPRAGIIKSRPKIKRDLLPVRMG